MKGIGNYSSVSGPQTERQAGTLVAYQGPRATITLMSGMTYSAPAEPFRKAGIEAHGRFIMATKRVGKVVIEVRVSKPPEARPPTERRQTPKVYVKDGARIATRR